jgi:hypothetical protein
MVATLTVDKRGNWTKGATVVRAHMRNTVCLSDPSKEQLTITINDEYMCAREARAQFGLSVVKIGVDALLQSTVWF